MNELQVSSAARGAGGGEGAIDTGAPGVASEDVHRFALGVLGELGLEDVSAAITFCDDDFIRDLNRRFRGKDEPTDVLSFARCDEGDAWAMPGAEDDLGEPERLPGGEKTMPSDRNIGDILISTQTLRANAAYFGVEAGEELRRLVVHGLMHLAGYDHESNDPSCPMLVRQEEILKRLLEATKR